MVTSNSAHRLDQHLRLRLAELDDGDFERFFLHFLNSGISLVIEQNGQRVERRIIEANTYAAGTGRKQKGIDLIAKVEGGETWGFQCKRHTTWNVSRTQKAIMEATYPANHYFLLVACDPHQDVQDEMDKYPQWSFWNLDRICQEFRLRVPKHMQPSALYFLAPEELRRFAPYATDALVPAQDYFASIQGAGHSFHHNYPLVGRNQEMAQLEAFVRDPTAKTLKISGKAGEGKSRLLWELAHTVCAKPGSPAVLFLNPHSTGDLTLALWEKDTPRIIVVDDAHRIERVSDELLGGVRAAEATKLVLATRPQGNEVLDERLREHGFLSSQVLAVTQLKKKDVMALATEALGPAFKALAQDLVGRTGDSPFLTASAGDLLKRGRLQWGNWHSAEEFRAAVFRSFETDNLDHLGEADRKQGARLLRIVALLAPATPDAIFHETAAKCLGIPRVELEALLRRLQAAGVVSAENHNVRVIPDLFADFLVFDTAFDPKHRLPELAATVLQEFSDQAASLLRNLAEASWIAGVQAPGREELLRPLLDDEFRRFDASSFFDRGRIIERWATFSVYLPGESLALAQKALTEKTAPAGAMSLFDSGDEDGINSHRYVRSWLSTLLKPVALWHDEHRHAALDFLWQLGIETPRGMLNGGKNHPWSVIAEVLKFTPHKPVAIVDSALQWVERLVQRPRVREVLVAQRAVLNTLLESCFERFVEFNEWQGRTMHWWTRPVDIQITAPLRKRAMAIIRGIIEQDSWRLALEGIGAAERALHRVAGAETEHVSQPEKFREAWRPERLKALELLPLALQKHPHTMLRFAIRRMLQRDLAYEEDPVFAVAVREVLTLIPSDFGLRLVTAINTQGYYEFAELMGAPIGKEAREKIKQRWKEYLTDVGREFLRKCPDPAAMIARLDQVLDESWAAGHHPNTGELFAAVTEIDPQRAIAFSAALLDPGCGARVAVIWHQVLYSLPASQAEEAERLLAIASEHPRTDIRRGVVDYFRFRDRNAMALSPAERALLERLAAKAGSDEIMSLVRLVQWVGPSCAEWGYELLGKLRLADLPDELNGEVLAALNPYHPRQVDPPLATVRHVLNALVKVPKIKVDHHGGGYGRILKLYPRAIYDFVLQRATRYEKSGGLPRYQVVPRDILVRFELQGLSADADFDKICGFLWEKMMGKAPEHMRYIWRELFQGIVLDRVDFWLPKLTAAVNSATSLKQLREVMAVIHFDGSLIVFFFPDLTKAILQRAEDIEGVEGYERMRRTLYAVSGPLSRSGTNGELDKDDDYVEAEAIKAATTHAADSVLGPFYRWIIQVEQHARDQSRRLYQANMASQGEE